MRRQCALENKSTTTSLARSLGQNVSERRGGGVSLTDTKVTNFGGSSGGGVVIIDPSGVFL